MEFRRDFDFSTMQNYLQSTCSINKKEMFTKSQFRELLSFAQSRREREVLKYTVVKASGLSATAAKKTLGIENVSGRLKTVELALQEAEELRKSIDDLCNTTETAVLQSLGLKNLSSSDESEYEDTGDIKSLRVPCNLPPEDDMLVLCRDSCCNWFEINDQLTQVGFPENSQISKDVYDMIYKALLPEECNLLKQSYDAYCWDRDVLMPVRESDVDSLNGLIVFDSDEEVKSSLPEVQKIAERRIKSIRRHKRYFKSKAFVERNFLSNKTTKRTSTILTKYPDIGKTIEQYVQDNSVGADRWRKTGILTFDGNTRVGQKVTFKRIQDHLQKLYGCKFSYGSVVELCVARNKRRKSAKRYHRVAQVTCRRARKGFQLKYNPDAHWSAAFYRGLNSVQYQDGRNIMNLNRDDASGFRLDTLCTHRLHKTPIVKVKEVLTTYTDYVNKYPSVLQTSSYNFSATKTTPELAAGVVKASGVYPKNPSQHAVDIEMLEATVELSGAFVHPGTGVRKAIECIRVDGASDEGPGHEEVQYWWTARHLKNGCYATVVTARSSGQSYLNRVELQNGCLALGHANLFIPSTLNGTNLDSSGKVDRDKLRDNLNLAMDVYISRVDGSPCGTTFIKLYKGADSCEFQKLRSLLLVFLKGSKAKRKLLQKQNPKVYKEFETVWSVRDARQLSNLPSQYCFALVCCMKSSCPHPICASGKDPHCCWYDGGPPCTYIPLPIVDTTRQWGRSDCEDCIKKGNSFCHGHYLKPELAVLSLSPPMSPPSLILKEAFKYQEGNLSSEQAIELAKKCLLPENEVEMWWEYLKTVSNNRKKAAATRSAKKNQEQKEKLVFCVVCRDPYIKYTKEVEKWIQCDICNGWVHFECAGLDEEPEKFQCDHCA